MKLKTYLTTQGMSIKRFAAKIGVSRSVISQIIDGTQPTLNVAKKIEAGTNNAVAVEELIYDPNDDPIGLQSVREEIKREKLLLRERKGDRRPLTSR